jgi:hypothetical protein
VTTREESAKVRKYESAKLQQEVKTPTTSKRMNLNSKHKKLMAYLNQ